MIYGFIMNKPRKKEVDTGRINKAGASIILVIAACFAISVLVGTNTN